MWGYLGGGTTQIPHISLFSRTRFVKGQKDKPARRQNRYKQRVSICEWNRTKEEHQRILLPTNCTL
jgi:hypothetical protein